LTARKGQLTQTIVIEKGGKM